MPETYSALRRSLSEARLARYLGEAKGDPHYGLRLYVWNARICEALYLPTQIGEVAVRNAIHTALCGKHGDEWHKRGGFLCTLPDRLKQELESVLREERTAYGSGMTLDHVISGLSFGFWTHLLTKNYQDVLWPAQFRHAFPSKPKEITRQVLHERVNRLRVLRNRIAHHKPIFDRSPTAEYQNLLDLLSWICADTRWFVVTTSRVAQVIGDRPR